MQSLYDLPAARKDARFRAWLTDFNWAGRCLAGASPVLDLRLARRVRRWYRAGLTPDEAVRRWQGLRR